MLVRFIGAGDVFEKNSVRRRDLFGVSEAQVRRRGTISRRDRSLRDFSQGRFGGQLVRFDMAAGGIHWPRRLCQCKRVASPRTTKAVAVKYDAHEVAPPFRATRRFAREGVEAKARDAIRVGLELWLHFVPVVYGIDDPKLTLVGDARSQIGAGNGILAAGEELAGFHREDGELGGVAEHAGGALGEEVRPVLVHHCVERLAVIEAVARLEADVERENAQLVDDVVAAQGRWLEVAIGGRGRSGLGRPSTDAGVARPRFGRMSTSPCGR